MTTKKLVKMLEQARSKRELERVIILLNAMELLQKLTNKKMFEIEQELGCELNTYLELKNVIENVEEGKDEHLILVLEYHKLLDVGFFEGTYEYQDLDDRLDDIRIVLEKTQELENSNTF